MALWLHVHGGYPSYVGSGEEWNRDDYDAYKLVQALKGHEFGGYATLQKVDGKWVTIRQQAPAPAFELFGEWAIQRLQELEIPNALIVPVPSSSCLAFGEDEKGRRLARAITDRHAGFVLGERLRWRADLGKAAEGGPRDSGTLFDNLEVQPAMQGERIVLVDDVATSGGHLLACARALRHQGHTVEHAICAAQTVNNHPASMWAIAPRDLEADPFETLNLAF